jgi:hypothetical protein
VWTSIGLETIHGTWTPTSPGALLEFTLESNGLPEWAYSGCEWEGYWDDDGIKYEWFEPYWKFERLGPIKIQRSSDKGKSVHKVRDTDPDPGADPTIYGDEWEIEIEPVEEDAP